jgi:AraC family transcriptional regulator
MGVPWEDLSFAHDGPCDVLVYPPGATLGPRQAHDFEFVWILEGKPLWIVNSQEHRLSPGTVVLRQPGIEETYVWDEQHQTRLVYFHFDLIHRGKRLQANAQWPVLRKISEDDVLPSLFRHVGWLQRRKPIGWESLEQLSLRTLLASFVTGGSGMAMEAVDRIPAPVEKALQLFETQAREHQNVTLPQLAKAAGVSSRHLTRLFQESIGCSPLEALRLIRLERSANLLVRSNLQIQEVAQFFGFESAFHYSKRFREAYGKSPRKFREEYLRTRVWPHSRLHFNYAFAGQKGG